MLPSILAEQLRTGLGDYIETTFPMTNAPFRGSVQRMLETENAVYHAPYIAVRLPFRVAERMPDCFSAIHPAYLPYVHQQKAFDRLTGEDGRSTLVATGTGSGKTECFLYPILEYCWQHRGERGIKALLIYPMNALASDQAGRIAGLIWNSPELRGSVTAGMYVGGQTQHASRCMSETGIITDHETLLNSPPDILLTNYKMLDYLLVRPKDADLWLDNGPETLKYIAVDELHTFDGAQGTDLACLLRRLKRRLGICEGWLCCIGTSATMGEKQDEILHYAEQIFGEPFEQDAVITEDRLRPEEFFADADLTEFSLPGPAETAQLELLARENDPDAYLQLAAGAWFPDFPEDVLSDSGRTALADRLMHHSLVQDVITLAGGGYYQTSALAAELGARYPELRGGQAETLLDSLFALISHARTGALRPFLQVQVQFWVRELRRLLAKVDGSSVTYALAADLNAQQRRQYLPVVNCRDCGLTGWTSVLNARQNAAVTSLDAFYNLYFSGSDKIVMLFPLETDRPGMIHGRICPDCLQVTTGEGNACPACGAAMVHVLLPAPLKKGGRGSRQFVCPCCGSRRGLSLMGLRSATEISASLSQLFASRFNDDKKALAFSDNVQDAAHRAGFFNARTWRAGLRGAIQQYCQDGGNGLSLQAFQAGFVQYWHERMPDADFISTFIGPNMTWMRAYEDMVQNREPGQDASARSLMRAVEQRVQYEILLEYGIASRIGRTLEKASCSMLCFDPEDLDAIAAAVQERTVNELGVLTGQDTILFRRMAAGWLDLMRRNGAFADPVFDEYISSGGNTWMLSSDRKRWLPGQQAGRNLPHMPADGMRRQAEFDAPESDKYAGWIEACCADWFAHDLLDDGMIRQISRLVLEEAQKQGVVKAQEADGGRVYLLDRTRVSVTDRVRQMRCRQCGTVHAVPETAADIWAGAPCIRNACGGILEEMETDGADYYGYLYRSGDLTRINAREHTGLLTREDREELEADFKRRDRNSWDPNVLSCTPTLEMGIDIGDLSTVILCSMPPSQSQFLQRAGRAGRQDGNALTLAIATARPHDLYFYQEPLEMIAGTVTPPQVFLRASAVLERQFVAFCMDSWVKSGLPDGAIPERVGTVLRRLADRPADLFPFNFLNYVQRRLHALLNSFRTMFDFDKHDSTWEELEAFACGNGTDGSPLYVRILDAFENLKRQQASLQANVKTLKDMIRELEAKPKDSSWEAEIRELKSEALALLNVQREISRKNTFNFLSDEGLLPNYAFPEAGVILKAILYRKNETETDAPASVKYDKTVYPYSRTASSAITEFAPGNSFYAGGRRLTIDQVDLTTAQAALWRLCPNCSHLQLEESGRHAASCPRCGSTGWADAGQVRPMLKVQMVYSSMDYNRSMIGDESEDRTTVFYCRQMLVDVDEEHDITSAYRMDNPDFPFGYEFVRKATLREINFGESDTDGERLTVSGVEDVRKGFRVCRYCGKLMPAEPKPADHALTCRARKSPELQADSCVECLFLYREFTTEVLRLLIPATTMDPTAVKTESFVAAFMLGMKEYFGNVDHLRATVCSVPLPDADYRKQYLVIYDAVPGGTGYLKQLMQKENALIEVFEKSLQVMETCSCRNEEGKDGCYHCLYAYRLSREIGNISRNTAVRMLQSILSGKHQLQKIPKISDIPVNPLFDSELEQRFVDALRARIGAADVSDTMRSGKHSYYIRTKGGAWEMEPQVSLGPEQGVAAACRPDFVFWPAAVPDASAERLPVAVFTDGFQYHRDIAADDTLKREAIRRSGRFRVWSLSFRDVQQVFQDQGDYAVQTLDAASMPSGLQLYQPTVRRLHAEAVNPGSMTAFDLLLAYLQLPEAEQVFAGQAQAYARSLLNFRKENTAFDSWKQTVEQVNGQLHFTGSEFPPAGTVFGTWSPAADRTDLCIYAGVPAADWKRIPVAVCAVLDDRPERRTGETWEQVWNGFWQFWNVMQFADSFAGVCVTGLHEQCYLELPAALPEAEQASDADWNVILSELLFDADAIAFARQACAAGIPAPANDQINYEFTGPDGAILAAAEIAWPARKLCFVTASQLADREVMEAQGWRIFTISDAAELLRNLEGETDG